jgi:hypothetical protein
VLRGVHFLLTYTCTYECDHCFLHCGSDAQGTFTLEQLRRVFREIERLRTVEMVYFEGGEPLLFYPLMLAGLRLASSLGLKTGIVSNAYWATSLEDAAIWLKPIRALGIVDLSISDDAFHQSTHQHSPAKLACAAAERLGIPCNTICIEEPAALSSPNSSRARGQPVVGGGVRFRGRAAEKLANGLPRQLRRRLTTCPDEDLEKPERVHLDSFGNVHICQGVSMGNMWESSLSVLVGEYDARAHPICGPLLAGGPARLAKQHGVKLGDQYVDECHYCYFVRKALVDRFPQYLAPRQVYGLT